MKTLRQYQAQRDSAMMSRHAKTDDSGKNGDTATILLNKIKTLTGLVDSLSDEETMMLGGTNSKYYRQVRLLGPAVDPLVFGQDYNIGNELTINNEPWRIIKVDFSPDGGNMVTLYVQDPQNYNSMGGPV